MKRHKMQAYGVKCFRSYKKGTAACSFHRIMRFPTRLLLLLVIPLFAGCSSAPTVEPAVEETLVKPTTLSPAEDSPRVAVVVNKRSPLSREVADYYIAKRGIPAMNRIEVDVDPAEEIPLQVYKSQIEEPVRKALGKGIDFIVTTKGLPLRTQEYGWSVDSLLAGMDLPGEPMKDFSREEMQQAKNPYYGATEPFRHAKYNLYLVTRIAAYDKAGCLKLIEDGSSAKAEKGLFFGDDLLAEHGMVQMLESGVAKGVEDLKKRGFEARMDGTRDFVAPKEPLMGYWSSGSNDPAFTQEAYHAIKFSKGGIAETNVSTSARTFERGSQGQSLIADLIEQGATGAKGYVSEPYQVAIARGDILFDRYTRGFTLAESFYAASPLIRWKDLVAGDPICRPYPRTK